jgi:hypothetical protein
LLCAAIVVGLMASTATSAVASGPPTATIGEVTEKSLNTAVVPGTVGPNGLSTIYLFEYGKTKLYGKTSSSKSVSGEGSIPVSMQLAGLEPLTTYHFRLKATNSAGTTYSADGTFEMLLAWKQGGKYLSEVPPIAGQEVGEFTQDWNTTTFVFEGSISKKAVKVSCESAHTGSLWVYGVLGSKYHFDLINCKTFLNGVESKVCAPSSSMTIELNGVMVPNLTKLILGKSGVENECTVGESIPFPAGFEVGPMAESKAQIPTLTGHSQFGVNNFTATIAYGEWKLTGPWVGQTFGIS